MQKETDFSDCTLCNTLLECKHKDCKISGCQNLSWDFRSKPLFHFYLYSFCICAKSIYLIKMVRSHRIFQALNRCRRKTQFLLSKSHKSNSKLCKILNWLRASFPLNYGFSTLCKFSATGPHHSSACCHTYSTSQCSFHTFCCALNMSASSS